MTNCQMTFGENIIGSEEDTFQAKRNAKNKTKELN